MFNHALRLVAAPLLTVTDVHLNISFSQVNINIPWARMGALLLLPPPPHSILEVSVSFTHLFSQNTANLISSVYLHARQQPG